MIVLVTHIVQERIRTLVRVYREAGYRACANRCIERRDSTRWHFACRRFRSPGTWGSLHLENRRATCSRRSAACSATGRPPGSGGGLRPDHHAGSDLGNAYSRHADGYAYRSHQGGIAAPGSALRRGCVRRAKHAVNVQVISCYTVSYRQCGRYFKDRRRDSCTKTSRPRRQRQRQQAVPVQQRCHHGGARQYGNGNSAWCLVQCCVSLW
jgi:hypothetical protein